MNIKETDKQEMPLQNATKRDTVTLVGVPIRVEYKGAVVYCRDMGEVQEMLRFIAGESERGGFASLLKSPWDAKSFWKFIETLREKQLAILKLLVQQEKISAEDLRQAVGVDTNQRLAGLLSGVSKQAAALEIPARAVFKIENESSGGKIAKSYVIAAEFAQVAKENNWVDDLEAAP